MDVALIGEGTYPHQFGGVSVWCDQLVRGMPDYDFLLVALVATGAEPVRWSLPDNVVSVDTLPLWGPTPAAPSPSARGRRSSRPVECPPLGELIELLLAPPAESQDRFGNVIREIFEFAQRENLTRQPVQRVGRAAAQRGLAGLAARFRGGRAHAARRGDRDAAARALAAPAVAPAGAGRRGARGDQRAGRAALAGGQVAVRHADGRHRARHLHARAVPAQPQQPVPVAGPGALPAIPAPPLLPRLRRGRADHPGQRLQQALGGTARREPRPRCAPSTTASTRPTSPRWRASPRCPRSRGRAASTRSRTWRRCCWRSPWCTGRCRTRGCACSARRRRARRATWSAARRWPQSSASPTRRRSRAGWTASATPTTPGRSSCSAASPRASPTP